MQSLTVEQPKQIERFPITLPLLGFWAFAFATLPFIGLGFQNNPTAALGSQVLLGMFLLGVVFLFVLSLVFTGGFAMIKPDKLVQSLTFGQALVIITGFLLVAIWQSFANQALFSTILAGLTDAQLAFVTKIDAAVAEEAVFISETIAIFLTLVYAFKVPRLLAAGITLPVVGLTFQAFHQYVLEQLFPTYGPAFNAAQIFILGARIILSGVLLGTLAFSRKVDPKTGRKIAATAALIGSYSIHVGWNAIA